MKRVGILGLPGSGKTTLFEILMRGAGAEPPTGSGREHLGVVRVPDARIDRLSVLFHPKKTTYTQIQLVDSGAAGQGNPRAGKGADLFAGVRDCDALLVVLRDFENPAVAIPGGVDPERDRRAVETELILNDLGIVESRLERIEKERRVGKQKDDAERDVLGRCRESLEAGGPLRAERLDSAEARRLRGFQFLSLKPMLAVLNQDERAEREPEDPGPGALALRLRAHLEREVLDLPPEERDAYRRELGIDEAGWSLVIRTCYRLLGLISFFTAGAPEVRAWTLRSGETAVDAAAEIHTDLARGFIRAEVIDWQALVDHGGTAGARAHGVLRLEGRDYVVKDGDCLEIRFNRT